jgi:hypothetical protein
VSVNFLIFFNENALRPFLFGFDQTCIVDGGAHATPVEQGHRP